jgi:maltose alpha-D-glucosyltransferase/alpha-amylase
VLFLHNLHEQPREILVDPGVNREQGKLLVNLLAENEGYAYRWYGIGGLDYLLRRSDIDQKDTGAE